MTSAEQDEKRCVGEHAWGFCREGAMILNSAFFFPLKRLLDYSSFAVLMASANGIFDSQVSCSREQHIQRQD